MTNDVRKLIELGLAGNDRGCVPWLMTTDRLSEAEKTLFRVAAGIAEDVRIWDTGVALRPQQSWTREQDLFCTSNWNTRGD